ncbi:MAG TPA: sugar phosphate nucleotidyltransferase, partial [Cyclobacteriaceae bacterium]|nr:sugar phosphate nucleotidyltransferase [Cyclobacteriaceae bacterium]
LHQSDITIDLSSNTSEIHNTSSEPWKITLLETGLQTMTGGRIKRAKDYIGGESFLLTYGDGVADLNINTLLQFHKSHGKLATMTAVQPEGRFGTLVVEKDSIVKSFLEKPKGDGTWVNGGFFVCEPRVIDYINDDTSIFEREPLEGLARAGELQAFKHNGFWKCMDTLRDKNQLNEWWEKNQALWKIWN